VSRVCFFFLTRGTGQFTLLRQSAVERRQRLFSWLITIGRGTDSDYLQDLAISRCIPTMDGWHSVLGTWNATTDNAEIAGEATKVNPGNNLATAIAPPSPLRDAHPHLPSIFCHYPQRSGHRLAFPFYPTLYLDTNQ